MANEILCKPSLLFLDEVTSGLDEQTDREMMNLFRSLADAGKTVVCITHSLANVERTCHLVVILGNGGKLVFVGKPAEALQYFGIDRLGDAMFPYFFDIPAERDAAWRKAELIVGGRQAGLTEEAMQQRLESYTIGAHPIYGPGTFEVDGRRVTNYPWGGGRR